MIGVLSATTGFLTARSASPHYRCMTIAMVGFHSYRLPTWMSRNFEREVKGLSYKDKLGILLILQKLHVSQDDNTIYLV
jgi:hypothetical protein